MIYFVTPRWRTLSRIETGEKIIFEPIKREKREGC
jgi:hypothetical protein